MRNCLVFFSIILQLSGSFCEAKDYEVIVDLTSTVGELKRIWDNTGLSPPGQGEESVKYLTSKDMFLNLALIGSLPFKAISHVRIHWLLDLISVRERNVPLYDFSQLDELLLWLRTHRMRPGFELMGNPGLLFSDLDSNPNTVVLWQNFITELAKHLLDKYGKEEVTKWRFELWNEPDSKQYNILNLTVSSYLKYAAASMKGLAVHGLTLSGPAGTFRDFQHHNISWGFLRMCNTMISLTGSEADILSGWWREESWRGDVAYASFVCEVIKLFLVRIKMDGLSLSYISNDNGFLNVPPAYFNQRTLLTRFQAIVGTPSQFVRKPVMVTMAMLSYLGPRELPIFLRHPDNSSCDSRLSVLAGSDGVDIGPGWSASIIISLSPGNATLCTGNKVELRLKLPEDIALKYVVYQLDNEQTNPRSVWEHNGKPDHPNDELLKEMRIREGPVTTQSGSVSGSWLSVPVRSPSVSLVHLCANPKKPPAKVLHLHAVNISFSEVLLLWHDSDTRCVKTYEVYFCGGECQTGVFKKISDRINVMLSFQYKAPIGPFFVEGTAGKYKVRVRDYWDQISDFSDQLIYGNVFNE